MANHRRLVPKGRSYVSPRQRRGFLYASVVLFIPIFAHAENWTHWRGPLKNGTAPDANPPLKWDAKTNIKWKIDLPGKGTSTPIVWQDRIFLLTAIDTGKEAKAGDIPKPDPQFRKLTKAPSTYHEFVVLCVDRQSGKKLWQKTAIEAVPHEGHHGTHSYAAFSPTTDGKQLYVSFGSQGVFCYTLDGKLVWKRTLGRLHTRRGWGEATPPVIHDQSLIVNEDHEGQSKLYVLNANNGKIRWEVKRDEPTTWATPLVVEHQGKKQLIVHGTNRVRSYDLETGKVLWSCGGQTVNAIPSPVVHEGVVYLMSGYRGSLAVAIPLDAKGDITDTKKVIWKHEQGTPYVPSPLLYKGRLYFTARNTGMLTSIDAKSGKIILDRMRLPEIHSIYASPVATKDRVYIVGRRGVTVVLEHGDKLKVLAINKLNDTIDASPVMIGDQLFLRSHDKLYCIQN